MTDEQPKPWVHGSDEDIVSTIAHALRHEGKRAIRQADQLIAQAAAARILEAMKRAYVITPRRRSRWRGLTSIPRWAAIGEGRDGSGIPGRR